MTLNAVSGFDSLLNSTFHSEDVSQTEAVNVKYPMNALVWMEAYRGVSLVYFL